MIIVGAKGEIKDTERLLKRIDSIATKKGVEIVVIDADYVCGEDHIISSYQHALRAFQEKRNSMRKFSMELLLYISGERQIKNALNKIGIKETTRNFAFIFMDASDYEELKGKISKDEALEVITDMGFKIDQKVIEPSREKLKLIGYSEEEIDTVGKDKYGDLILERVAMVDVIK